MSDSFFRLFLMRPILSKKLLLLLICIIILLLMAHLFFLSVPLFDEFVKCQPLDSDTIENCRYLGHSLGFVISTLFFVVILAILQQAIIDSLKRSREKIYKEGASEICNWLRRSDFFLKGESVLLKETNSQFIISELYHLKISGFPNKIIQDYSINSQYYESIHSYCNKVHFELTKYPAEILYGIHFELDKSYEFNKHLADHLRGLLGFEKQYTGISVDDYVPKKPNWIFLTKKVDFQVNMETDFLWARTHLRHFVELVCHYYEFLYGRDMIEFYLSLEKSSANVS